MYKTILVPLDRSKRAEAILPHVENLALKCKAKVIFMKVIDIPPIRVTHSRKPVEQHRKELEELEKRDGEYLSEMQHVFVEKGIGAATLLTQGAVVEEIVATAERESADLIAIASHGRGGCPVHFTAAWRQPCCNGSTGRCCLSDPGKSRNNSE